MSRSNSTGRPDFFDVSAVLPVPVRLKSCLKFRATKLSVVPELTLYLHIDDLSPLATSTAERVSKCDELPC